jgi:hypothetical protein
VLLKAATSPEWGRFLVNRPALGIMPPADWGNTLHDTFMSVAPKGLHQVFTAMCGSCANECAYKAVFMNYMHKARVVRVVSSCVCVCVCVCVCGVVWCGVVWCAIANLTGGWWSRSAVAGPLTRRS